METLWQSTLASIGYHFGPLFLLLGFMFIVVIVFFIYVYLHNVAKSVSRVIFYRKSKNEKVVEKSRV